MYCPHLGFSRDSTAEATVERAIICRKAPTLRPRFEITHVERPEPPRALELACSHVGAEARTNVRDALTARRRHGSPPAPPLAATASVRRRFRRKPPAPSTAHHRLERNGRSRRHCCPPLRR